MRSKSYSVFKRIYRNIFFDFIHYLKGELSDCNSVLDLGCGYNSPIQYCDIPYSVGVEMFRPYLQESRKKKIHGKYISEDVRKINFEPNSFDTVVALDLIEHLTKEEGHELIKKMEKWARKKIIIFTPNGYVYQDDYDEDPLQRHKCGWTPIELKGLGFKVYGLNGWKRLRGYRGKLKYKPFLLWKVISNLTQKITYYYPDLAFHLFAVYEVSK